MMGTWAETKEHARRTLISLTGSRRQTATAMAALALPALLSPIAAVASAAAAGALVYARSRERGPFATLGDVGARESRDIYPIGTMEDGTSLALDVRQICSGMLVYGTTGSGRKEALLGIAEGMLAKGSGMVFLDGVGDVSVYADIHVMTAALGREDDVIVVAPFFDDGTARLHGFNPFDTGTLQELTTLVADLMVSTGSDPVWKERAVALTNLVLEALVIRRDGGRLSLDLKVLVDALHLENVQSLTEDRDLPAPLKERVRNYLEMLPGFQPERGMKQSQHTIEQHGYVTMHAAAVLRPLVDAGIMSPSLPQVDLEDVLLNDRILIVMLPSQHQAPLEAAICSKAVVAALRMAMTRVDRRCTSTGTYRRSSPIPIVLNDVASVGGVGAMGNLVHVDRPGFSMIYGFQDERVLTHRWGEIASDLIANTDITIRLEEQGMGRMISRARDAECRFQAIHPRTLRPTAECMAFKRSAVLGPVDLVSLTSRPTNPTEETQR